MKQLLPIYFLLISFSIHAQSYKSLPGKIEAEDFSAMNSVATQPTTDINGGLNISWINDGSWMDYNVNVAAQGYYTIKFRIANAYSPEATLSLRSADGIKLGQIRIPETGGSQGWQTVRIIALLPAGNQTLRIYAEKGGFNLNWFEGNESRLLSGRMQAEDFDVMHEVQTESTGDVDGNLNVGYIDDGDWMDYNVKIASAGTYTLNFRIANAYGNGIIEIKTGEGIILGQVNVMQTGGWQNWATINTTVSLPAGSQIIRIFAKVGAFNFNWFEIAAPQQPTAATLLPGKLEAETYDQMSNVAKESTSDTDGGENVGWIQDNSWMDYKVNVAAAGIYTLNFRIANAYSPDAALALKANDGTILGRLSIPQTGGSQGWKTVNMIAALPAGNQTLRVFAEKGGWNFNWINAVASRPLSGRIEAESFDVTSGVSTENANDTDGGTAVNYIENDDWMDYNVNVASAGTYTINFRIANGYDNGKIEIRTTNGTALGQLNVPLTHGWQNWTTAHVVVNLAAGSQILRMYAIQGGYNLNWFEVVPGIVQSQSVISFAALPAKTVGNSPFDLIATSNNTETPITFTSSNPGIVTVSNSTGSWKATIIAAGQTTITASQTGNSNFSAAESIVQALTINGNIITPPTVSIGTKIPIDPKRWYQLTNAANGLEGFFDGETQVEVHTGWGKIINNYEAYYPLQEGEVISLQGIKFFDFTGSAIEQPMVLSIITDQWQRIPIATFTGDIYNGWVGPYPDRHLSGDNQFKLDATISNARYLVLTIPNILPTEIEFYGSYTAPTPSIAPARTKNIKLRDLLGVNGYEWNFQDGVHAESLVESKVTAAKSFTGLRHYMDWEKLESTQGVFSYNPTLSGSWNYDLIYERCKQENIEVLACLKTLPNWMLNTYPESERDAENVPVIYGKDFTQPLSYLEQAKVAFQYAARYGSNTSVDPSLLSVSTTPRWYGDYPNTVRIGLNLIKYIECDNERDKTWKGRKGYQTAREYAANLSAFYDGHKNTMGVAAGVKNADPNMKVVIAGLVTGADYVKGMVDWCREFRGYNPDGTVNLCWDIVNFHLYTDNASSSQSGTSTRGAAPEVTNSAEILQNFVKVSRELCNDLPVWITEAGYDIAQNSPLKAIAIGNKSAQQTQADWILRTSLSSARNGIEKVFYYQMYDDNPLAGIFGSSGLINDNETRRPSADYFFQTNKLFGEYVYKETLNHDPIVDRYELDGKSLYILTVPDEVGRTANYNLNLGATGLAKIYTPTPGSDNMAMQEMPVNNGNITVTASETPIFVIASAPASNARVASSEIIPVSLSEDNVAERKLIVYPNPATEFITIDMANDISYNLEVKIFDAGSGRLYKEEIVSKNGSKVSHKMNISHLPTGTYVMDVKQGNTHSFQKVVKIN